MSKIDITHSTFTKEQLRKPIRIGGTDYTTGIKIRNESFTLLSDISYELKLPNLVTLTAMTYFHRFFARYDFADFDIFHVSAACLFLAAKVEETHRKLKDVIVTAYKLKHREKLSSESQTYSIMRQDVIAMERRVLQTMAFDLSITHPHVAMIDLVKKLFVDEEVVKNVQDAAWRCLNDSYRSEVCLQFKPVAIAAAAIFLATCSLNIVLPSTENKSWTEIIQVSKSDIDEIVNQIKEACNGAEISST